jgi:ComF family protein
VGDVVFIIVIRFLANFLFPLSCVGCGRFVDSKGLCAQCWSSVDFIVPPYCALCGNSLGERGGAVCRLCRQKTPLFNSHQSLFAYGPLTRQLIFGLKYGRKRYLTHLFAQWLLPKALQHVVDIIVPVPLHPRKLAQRGFNQAALVADALGRLMGIPVHKKMLVRHLNTPSQGFFSQDQREENVFGAFSVPKVQTKGARILLIDDVYTTGATLGACTYALKESGALHVHALTLAKVLS